MTVTITKPGIYDLDVDEYHADTAAPGGSLSSTWARKLMEPAGPARFIHERRNPQPHKKVFDYGHAAHGLVLGSGAPLVEIPAKVLAKNGAISTDEAKAFVDDVRATGGIPLKAHELTEIRAMADALQSNPDAVAALNPDGMHETSAFRTDDTTGMWLRGRFDSITPGSHVADYKTTVDADPGKFARRTAHELGYHQQAAWYLDLAAVLGLVDPDAPFRFVLQEKTAPYLASVVELDPEYLFIGRNRNRAAIDLYARCKSTDTWPGFTGTATVGPPKWLGDAEDQQLADDIADELAAYAHSLKTGTPS